MRFDLYNCEDRQVDGTLNKIEPCLAAAVSSKGMHMVQVLVEPTDSIKDCEFEKDSLINNYVPKPRTVGMITTSYTFGWIYNMYFGNKVIYAGDAIADVLKEAREYAIANNTTIKVTLSPIDFS